MRLLLDTHALLWWMADDPKLGHRARGLIADPDNDISVSAASLWEIVVKIRIGKLDAEIAEIPSTICSSPRRSQKASPSSRRIGAPAAIQYRS